MNVSIIANSAPGKCSKDDFEATIRLLEKHGHTIMGLSWAENSIDAASLCSERPDFVVVIGGDGTIISACHFFGDLQVPLLGVNVGKLGYLAHFGFDHLGVFLEQELAEALLNKRFISERMLLQVQIGDSRRIAVNDLVLDIGPPFRTSETLVKIDGYSLPMLRGDGVIVATPTGSTAYTLSAGGSIIHPEVEGIAVTPKNPHRLSFRPLVVRSDSTIEIATVSEGVYFIVDGQFYTPATEIAKVTRFHQNLQIVTRKEYWSTLTEKLHWGE